MSIGISMYPDDGIEMYALIKHADAAMYQAKENGPNTCAFRSSAGNGKANDMNIGVP